MKLRSRLQQVEWPTILLISSTFLVFAGLTLFYHNLPWLLVIPLAGYVLALYGSLQHEVLHGHPTPWQWLNELMVFPALGLWIPYSVYKQTHLVHHNNENLTNPDFDPESYYQPRDRWQNYSSWTKAYFVFCNTFAGRLLWGPVHIVVKLFLNEARAIANGAWKKLKVWVIHGVAVALVFAWVSGFCKIPILEYILLFSWPGLSLTLMRSFLEHRATPLPEQRSVIVESNSLLSTMYLYNNLHAIHHEDPGLPWYRIPAVWESDRKRLLDANDHYYYTGYVEIALRYFGKAKENPCFPHLRPRSHIGTHCVCKIFDH